MPLPKVRFRIRSVMIAVAIVAVVLAVEPVMFHYAAEEVRSGDPEYILGEAVTVWVMLNIPFALAVGCTVLLLRAALGHGVEA